MQGRSVPGAQIYVTGLKLNGSGTTDFVAAVMSEPLTQPFLPLQQIRNPGKQRFVKMIADSQTSKSEFEPVMKGDINHRNSELVQDIFEKKKYLVDGC